MHIKDLLWTNNSNGGSGSTWMLKAGGVTASMDTSFTGGNAYNNAAPTTATDLWACVRASSGTYCDNNGTLLTFGSGILRMGNRGLLVESASTNILTDSNSLGNWVQNVSATTPSPVFGPDLTLSAWRVTNTGIGGRVTKNTVATGTQHVYSVFIKPGNTTSQRLLLRNTTTATNVAYSDFHNATEQLTVIAGTSGFERYRDGWYRIWVKSGVADFTIGDTITCYIYPTAVGEEGAYVDCCNAQCEAISSFVGNMTTYIPTTTVAATRAFDAVDLVVGNFPYNTATGTLYAEGEQIWSNVDNPLNKVISAIFTNNNDLMSLCSKQTSVTTAALSVNVSGVNNGSVVVANKGVIGNHKYVACYNTNDFQFCVDGTLGTQDTTGNIPTVAKLRAGSQNGSEFNGYIKRIAYWDTRISDANMQVLTT